MEAKYEEGRKKPVASTVIKKNPGQRTAILGFRTSVGDTRVLKTAENRVGRAK